MLNFKRIKPSTIRLGVGICTSALAVLVVKKAYQVHCASPKTDGDSIITKLPSISSKLPTQEHHGKPQTVKKQTSLKEAIELSKDLVQRVQNETGAPGIIVGVSINGRSVWEEGLGYSDVENRVQCTPKTVMRIASISKSLTAVAAAKLWENNKLDLDKPINEYLTNYPDIKFNDEKVNINSRQLLSHSSGIRHYNVIDKDQKEIKDKTKDGTQMEFLIKDKFESVTDSLSIFKNDPLLFKPGTKYNYTTFGYTLLSAVIEKVADETFPIHMSKLFNLFGMKYTRGDVNDALIYNRSHYYIKNVVNGSLLNAPFVDNSYKWAGGGIISTVGDLLKFANIMLYSAQTPDITDEIKINATPQKLPGFLKQSTVKMLWSTVIEPKMKGGNLDSGYGLGWCVVTEEQQYGGCRHRPNYVFHTGGAVGASSILLILPTDTNFIEGFKNVNDPQGVCVAIVTNIQNVTLTKTALEIAEIFKNVKKGDVIRRVIVPKGIIPRGMFPYGMKVSPCAEIIEHEEICQ